MTGSPTDRSVASADASGREPTLRSFVVLTDGRLPWIDAMAIIHELLNELSEPSRRVALAAIIEAHKLASDAARSASEDTQAEQTEGEQ